MVWAPCLVDPLQGFCLDLLVGFKNVSHLGIIFTERDYTFGTRYFENIVLPLNLKTSKNQTPVAAG
jgi:hypothetical protein